MPINEIVSQRLEQLRALSKVHMEVARDLLKDPTLYLMDMLALAVLRRSLQLIVGFTSLIRSQNFGAAAPLLRLQVDSCIRFAAAWLAEDSHSFVSEILRGTPVRKMKTREGQLMTDRYLVEQLAAKYPWLPSVYEHASGYIHFSEKHMFNCMKVAGERTLDFRISEVDFFITDDLYLEAIEAFEHSTDIILTYCHGWAHTKNNPHLVTEKANAQR